MSFDESSHYDEPLSPEVLEKLLRWLDADPEQSWAKYARIRAKLLKFFEDKGCASVHKLADETVLRVIKGLSKSSARATSPEYRFEKACEKVLRNYFKRWAMTKEALDRMLNWLDTDAEQAGRKYQQIHSVLSAVFRNNGFADAEALADETITRVIRKLPEIEDTYSGNPALYFSAVARRICQESRRRKNRSREVYDDYEYHRQMVEVPFHDLYEQGDDSQQQCFFKCLHDLPPNDYELLMAYYKEEKREKINIRKHLAQRFGITAGNLRVRRYRIYNALVACIKNCLGETN